MYTINPFTGNRILKGGKTWDKIVKSKSQTNPTFDCCNKYNNKMFKLQPFKSKDNFAEFDTHYRKKISTHVNSKKHSYSVLRDEDIYDIVNLITFIEECLEEADVPTRTFNFNQILESFHMLWSELDELDRRIYDNLERNFSILIHAKIVSEL